MTQDSWARKRISFVTNVGYSLWPHLRGCLVLQGNLGLWMVQRLKSNFPRRTMMRFYDQQHCGLWRSSAARSPPAEAGGDVMEGARFSDSEPHELTYVDMVFGQKTWPAWKFW